MPIKFSSKPDNEFKALVSPLNIFRSLIFLLQKKEFRNIQPDSIFLVSTNDHGDWSGKYLKKKILIDFS